MSISPIPILSFFENYAEAVLITREDDSPLLINSAFSKMSGFGPESLSNLSLSTLLGGNSGLNHDTSKRGVHWESGLVKSDGSVAQVKISLSTISLSDQSKGRVYTITKLSFPVKPDGLDQEGQSPLSELELIKNELEAQAVELKRTKEELEQFAYVASHDLNEPLRMISGYIQLIQKKIEQGSTQDLKEFMNFVLDGTARMQRLIQDLLQFSRINREGNPLVPVQMSEVINIALVRLSDKIKKSGSEIQYDSMPKVQGDSAQLIQLISYLLENAIKFCSPDRKPEIKISVEEKDGMYLFGVKDNGIGIEQKFYERIFVIFQRLHSRSEYEGTGLGLAMCKRIAVRHRGDIWVESEPGKGSTFYFTLKK